MNNQNNINKILNAWGRNERHLPLKSEALKDSLLAKFGGLSFETPPPASRRAPWLSIAFAGFAVVLLFISYSGTDKTGVSYMSRTNPMTLAPAVQQEERLGGVATPEAQKNMIAPDYFPRRSQDQTPITDSREFLKTDYHATILTRNVQDLTRRAETTVRGFGGRVDSVTDSELSGFVSFVVPADKFESFRNEIESFVGKRFLNVQIQSENLLPQKQSVENQKQQIETALGELRDSRKKLVSTHNKTVSNIQNRLAEISNELVFLRAQGTSTQVIAQEQVLLQKQEVLLANLSGENYSYPRQLSSLDQNIRSYESSLQYVATQDQGLIDTVATVRGTISLQWISIWDMVQLYVSLSWITSGLFAAAIVAYIWHRRRLAS